MKVLAILGSNSIKQQVQLAFQEELPEIAFNVIAASEVNQEIIQKVNPDMVVIEKGLPDVDNANLIREVRLTSRAPVVIMSTEKDAFNVDKTDSDKYESILNASLKTRLPIWLKRFFDESGLLVKPNKGSINNCERR